MCIMALKFKIATPELLPFAKNCVLLPPETKHVRMMTTLQRLKSTRMAPYIGLMQQLTREEKQIVVTFLTESVEKPKAKRQVPAEFKRLRGMASVTEEDMAMDEHLAHIMER